MNIFRTLLVGAGIGLVLLYAGISVATHPVKFLVLAFILNGLAELNRKLE